MPRCPRPVPCPSRAATTTCSSTAPSTTTSATSGTSAPCSCRGVGTARGSSLRFDAATHRPSVWVDDTLVAEHEGGYTPFEADVSELAGPGEPIRLTVVVNNELTGIAPARHRRGDARRSAPPAPVPRLLQLRRAPPQRVAVLDTAVAYRDATVMTELDDGTGSCAAAPLSWRTGARRKGTRRSASSSATPREQVVARASGEEAELRVPDASLWQPGPRLSLRAADRPHGRGPPGRPLRAPRRHPDRPRRRDALPHQRRALLLPRASESTRTSTCTVGVTTTRRWCTTSRSSGGSGPTRSGRRTTPTPRRCSTWPTASASSSSTRRRPSA